MFKHYLKNVMVLLLVLGLVVPVFAQEKEKKKGKKHYMVIEKERAQFHQLLIQNINYFGTFPGLKTKAIKPMMYNTKYEQIKCLGFHPARDELKAVLDVKLSYGYKSGLCSGGGSYEYVRFFADWNNDGDYEDADEDLGMSSVNVHDIPDYTELCRSKSKPLAYAVSLRINPPRDFCTNPKLVKVRAILSWEYAPPAGDPDFMPPWGNRIEKWVQIRPKFPVFKQVVDLNLFKQFKLDPSLLEYKIPLPKPKKMPFEELKQMYADTDVPELRFGTDALLEKYEMIKRNPSLLMEFQQLQLSKKKAAGEMIISDSVISAEMVGNIADLLAVQFDTTYEQLNCIGLNYDRDTLVGTLTVKKSSGYSGDLCTWKGSHEYVAFWAKVLIVKDSMAVCDWVYLGTANVNVFDIPNLPTDGLKYAVSVPVDLSKYKKDKCDPKPTVLKIRAVLSWNQTPPPDNPDWIPPWGNRLEALIQPKPMPTGPVPNQPVPDITSVGDMAVMKIDANGYANGTAVVSGFEADNSPFGGMVAICGHIYNAPNLSKGETALKYCAYYREVGSSYWNKITNKFQVTLTKWNGTISTQTSPDQEVDTDGYYTYQEDLATDIYGSPQDLTQTYVEGDVLAKWYTQGLADGLYEIKFSVKNPSGDIDSNIVKVRLDNTPPTANVTITAVVSGGVTSTASPCGTFTPPEIIKGLYTAADAHFRNFRLEIQPKKYNPNPVNPSSGTTGGMNLPWELSTSGMTPCGYTINLHVYDRTIVNSGYIGWYAYDSDGFCIQ